MLSQWMYFWDWNGAPPTSTSSTAVVALIGADPRGWGAKGDDDYHPMPEEYWEAREKIIQVDKRKPGDVFNTEPVGPKILTAAEKKLVGELTTQRDALASNLMAVPSIEHLKNMAGEIRSIDARISKIKRS